MTMKTRKPVIPFLILIILLVAMTVVAYFSYFVKWNEESLLKDSQKVDGIADTDDILYQCRGRP